MKENVNENLKKSVSTEKNFRLIGDSANFSRNVSAEEQISDLAKFPEENPFPVLRIKNDGTILYSNKPGQVLLEQWNCKIGQKAPEEWCKLVSKALKSNRYLVNEVNCSKKMFSFAVAPVPEGEYVNLYGRDITTQKRTEERIRQSEEHVRNQLAEIESIYNTAVVGLCVFDRDLRYVRINQHMAEMNGLSIDEHIGKTLREVAPRLAGTMERVAKKVFRTGEPVLDVEISGMTKAEPGLLHYWKQHWLSIKDDTGEVRSINVVTEDISEFKRIEQSLLEINQTLGKKVQTQSQELSRTVEVLQEEVAERVRAEQDLKESSEVLDAFFAHAITPLVILDRKFNFIRVNKAYADGCQRDISEFEGHNHFEFYPHKENEGIFKKVVRTKRSYQAIAKPFTFPDHPEWGVTYWDWTLVPILGEDERVEFLVFSLRDVTKRKQVELVVKESEEKYRSLVELSPEAVCVAVDEKVVFANTAALKLIKAKDTEELTGRSIWDFIHPDSTEVIKGDIRELLEKKSEVPARETRLICFDGSTVEVEASATYVIHQGNPGVLAIFHDITERKRAQEMVKAERQQMNDVLETLPAYVCLLTPDYRVPFANHVFREAFGYLPDKKCYEFLFNRTEPCEDCQTFTVLKTNKPHRWEWTGPNDRDYDIFDFPFKDTDGSQLILEMGMDITERKRAEERIRTTNSLLEQFAQKTSRKEYLDSVVKIIRDWSSCRCVGIRLTNSDGYIPYASCVGFSEEFLSLESNLCLKEDVCACIRVVAQTPEPQDADVMTEKGSFRCDNTFGFVDSLSEKEKKRFRGNCLKAGFASVAVVPVRYRQNILGAIHIADEGENKVPLETVKFLEDMAVLIGEAVHRFNVEESLVLNEQRLLDAQRVTHLGNWEWDIIKNRLWWSDEVYRIFGLEPQQFSATYDAFLSYVHPDDRKLVEDSVNKALYGGHAYNIDHRVIKPNGSEQTVNERAEVIYDSERKPIKMIGTVHDITERKQAENEIRENQKELRAMAARLQLVEEQERRKLAQDLHDSIGQILSFSGRQLKALQKSLPANTAKSVREITNQLDIAVEQARTLSFDLSPSALYDLGFEVAIEDLVDRMSKERKIRCQFENCSRPKPLTDDVKVLLYRTVRELLINTAKHANAGFVKVSLLRSSSDIYIKVEDDGDGFDVSVLNSGSRKGFGLFSICERLNHIGGQLKIDSGKGKGTRAILTAPLDVEDEEELGVNL